MCEETTGYDPASGLYVVKDGYKLDDKGLLELGNHDEKGLDDASFTLIKSFEVTGDKIKRTKIDN